MKVESGKIKKPFVILIHGEQGVGKSTFANDLPKAIFLGTENTEEISCSRAERLEATSQLKDQLDWLTNEKHDFKTVVIDCIDGIEQLMIQEIVNSDTKAQKKTMNSVHGGYNAGFNMLEKDMLDLRTRLQLLRDKKAMNVCVIAHTKRKNTVDPVVGDVYDEYKLALHEKTENVWVDWVSAVLMIANVVEKKEDERFAFGRGDKIIYTQRRPGILAKNRYGLPFEMQAPIESPAKEFLSYYERFFSVERAAEEIKANIVALLTNISDESLIKSVQTAVEGAKNNATKLAAIEKRVIERVG